MRLYFGVKAACRSMGFPRLRHHFGGEVARLLLDTLADDEERVAIHFRLLCREHLLHRLLVVLDERLPIALDLAGDLFHAPSALLGAILGGLAGFPAARLVILFFFF